MVVLNCFEYSKTTCFSKYFESFENEFEADNISIKQFKSIKMALQWNRSKRAFQKKAFFK